MTENHPEDPTTPIEEGKEEVSISELMQQNLEKATKDASEYKDKYFRALAEMENTRKRLQQEKQEMIAYAIDNMLSEFLMPLDNLENALKFTDQLSDEMKNWAQGFKMIAAQFTQVLENHGIVPFESVGHPFDPHLHEAVERVNSAHHAENTIIEEVQAGYRHNERILRVAKVKVATKASSEEEKLTNIEESQYDEEKKQ